MDHPHLRPDRNPRGRSCHLCHQPFAAAYRSRTCLRSLPPRYADTALSTAVSSHEEHAPGVPRDTRRSDLLDFRQQFHDRYFSEQAGGMFLPQAARDDYFTLQNELQSVAGRMSADSELVGPDGSASLRTKASALRHQLTTDLGAAERPRANWIIPRSIAPPPQRGGAMTSNLPLQG